MAQINPPRNPALTSFFCRSASLASSVRQKFVRQALDDKSLTAASPPSCAAPPPPPAAPAHRGCGEEEKMNLHGCHNIHACNPYQSKDERQGSRSSSSGLRDKGEPGGTLMPKARMAKAAPAHQSCRASKPHRTPAHAQHCYNSKPKCTALLHHEGSNRLQGAHLRRPLPLIVTDCTCPPITCKLHYLRQAKART